MITITYEKLMAALALFTALCVAGGWLIRIIKSLKKPSDDVAAKLENDNERIENLKEQLGYISNAISVLMRSNLAILGHLSDGNHTGEMAKREKEIQEFLIDN